MVTHVCDQHSAAKPSHLNQYNSLGNRKYRRVARKPFRGHLGAMRFPRISRKRVITPRRISTLSTQCQAPSGSFAWSALNSFRMEASGRSAYPKLLRNPGRRPHRHRAAHNRFQLFRCIDSMCLFKLLMRCCTSEECPWLIPQKRLPQTGISFEPCTGKCTSPAIALMTRS